MRGELILNGYASGLTVLELSNNTDVAFAAVGIPSPFTAVRREGGASDCCRLSNAGVLFEIM